MIHYFKEEETIKIFLSNYPLPAPATQKYHQVILYSLIIHNILEKYVCHNINLMIIAEGLNIIHRGKCFHSDVFSERNLWSFQLVFFYLRNKVEKSTEKFYSAQISLVLLTNQQQLPCMYIHVLCVSMTSTNFLAYLKMWTKSKDQRIFI